MGGEPLAVVLGAGNIGKGLLGELFQDAGLKTVFIEKDPAVVERLRKAGSYQIRLHSAAEVRTRTVEAFEVYGPHEPAAERALRRAEVCATAVGVSNLQDVAHFIAAACRRGRGSLGNVLVCENYADAAHELSGHVANRLPELRTAGPGFVQCCIERIVARSTVEAGGEIFVDGEYLYPLSADGPSWNGPHPDWPGLDFVADVRRYFDRKLYTSNFGHALLGYVGYVKGHTMVWEAADDPEISAFLEEMLDRVAEALLREHDSWTSSSLREHIDSLRRNRYANRTLGDTIARVCRDPLRKLTPDERIVGTIRLLERNGLPTDGFGRIIAGAVLFALDREAGPAFRRDMDRAEMKGVLSEVTGLKRSSQSVAEALQFIGGQGG